MDPARSLARLYPKYKIRDHFGEDISTNVTPGSPQDYAHYSFAGGRIELLYQGYLKAGYLAAYDVASAYPAGAVELPSLAPHTGQWVLPQRIKRNKFSSRVFIDIFIMRDMLAKCTKHRQVPSNFKVRYYRYFLYHLPQLLK
jgi:hypothetical protein